MMPKKKQEALSKRVESARFLALASGMTVLIGGILAIVGMLSWPFEVALTGMITGIASGLIILIAAVEAAKRPRTAGIVILIFSLVALAFPPNGLVFGPLLGLGAAALLLIRPRLLA